MNLKRWLLVGGFAVLLVPPSADATPVFNTAGGAAISLAPTATIGYLFKTGSSAITVTALDAILNNGVTATVVRIYDAGLTTVATAAVSTLDPTETAGLTWFSHAISPVTLAANTQYFIVEDAPSSLTYNVATSVPVASLGLTYIQGVSASGAGGKPFHDALGNDGLNPAYFGPNFGASLTVPEPASVVILGFLGAVCLSRRKLAGRSI